MNLSSRPRFKSFLVEHSAIEQLFVNLYMDEVASAPYWTVRAGSVKIEENQGRVLCVPRILNLIGWLHCATIA
jgi:hypothetical protein